MQPKLGQLEKAIKSLEAALKKPKDEFIRDATIQRFEYSFELTWKTAKYLLGQAGIESLSPRSVIRDLGQQRWIENIDLWMEFLDYRNLTTHTYNEKTAEQVYEGAKRFLPECKLLIETMKLQSEKT